LVQTQFRGVPIEVGVEPYLFFTVTARGGFRC
jgi:hypothetical protein